MEFTNEFEKKDSLNFTKPVLPQGLNVLTILSIIGSVLGIIGGIYQFVTAKTNYDNKEEMLKQFNDPNVPESIRKMAGDPQQMTDMIVKSYENRLPIMIITVVASALCLYGVLQMRKLKKAGYPLYVVGELLPILGTLLFIGAAAFSSTFSYIGIFVAILFVILYTVNRKHLVY